MSEEGWRGFLSADGVEDWVVCHGGPTAVFEVGSLIEATRLAEQIAGAVPDPGGIVLTAATGRLTVRLTRDLWHLEPAHVELARSVSVVARVSGATANRRAVQEVQVAIAALPPEIDLPFWRAVLGYFQSADDAAADPLGHGSTVWMQDLDPSKPLRHAMHIDVSVGAEFAQERINAALAAGGRIVDDSEAPRWWTLRDPAGNRVCLATWPDGGGLDEKAPVQG